MANNCNFNDSLYIHPSDTPGMNLVNDQLIGVDNYGIWSRAMLIALRVKNKIALIDGNCRRPPIGSPNSLQWDRCNALVLSWIINTVSMEIFGGIVYASDASSVWTDLKEQFEKVNGSRIFSLHREIGRLTQGNSTISTYYCKLKLLWDEYSALVTLPSCECDTARTYLVHEQQQRLLQFLMGLNDSYLNIRSQILMMSPLPTVGQAFSLISQKESHRVLSSVEVPTAAFYTNQTRIGSSMKERANLICDHCSRSGHTMEHCYKIVGYPPWHKLYKPPPNKGPNKKVYTDNTMKHRRFSADANIVEESNTDQPKASTGAPSLFTPCQYAEILKVLGSNNVQNDCAPVVNMAGTTSQSLDSEWIIDTGAIEHMIGDVSLLQGSKSLADSTGTMNLPNGSKANVNKIGSAPLTISIQLDHDLKTGRVMGIGKEKHGLYHFTSKAVARSLPKDNFTFPPFASTFDRLYFCSANGPCKAVNIDT
ncbi:uncharacterized protein LOC142521318 [Primulina tabacum]|uniref:uncharacterized protein LOC142521318 n=1 Tax=Primulina tabacum TaxID=48773 RepID=UPI003F5AD195